MKEKERIWDNISFRDKIELPNDIARKFCNQLYGVTDKKVLAKVEPYNKNISDMNNGTIIDIQLSSFIGKSIQENLGETGKNSKFTFELFLTGTKTKEYKYRFGFIEYGAIYYPVQMVIDEDIAKELGISTFITCNNEDEFVETLILVLKSKRLYNIIKGLLAIN